MDLAEIRRFGEGLAAADPAQHASDQLAQWVIAFERLRNCVEAADVAFLAEFHERGGWAADGALSGAAWVASRTGSPRRDVRRRQQTGLGLRLLPAASRMAVTGHLSGEHLRSLADCAIRHPEIAARDESVLVEQAGSLRADDFGTVARHWCAAADDASQPDAGEAPVRHRDERRSRVQVSRTLDGVGYLSGVLAPGDADLVESALAGRFDQLLRARHDGDPSLDAFTPAELRGQALVDLLAQTQRREPSQKSQPDRYRVAVVVRAYGDPSRPASVEEAVASCDAPRFRAVLAAASEVLDIGRQSDEWPTAIRRAITLRDGGCVFPGCDRPSSWCDVHHCRWWSNEGETKVDNGALLCRRHHTFLHAKRWSISIPKARGKPEVRRPDGTVHTIEPWPDVRAPAGA